MTLLFLVVFRIAMFGTREMLGVTRDKKVGYKAFLSRVRIICTHNFRLYDDFRDKRNKFVNVEEFSKNKKNKSIYVSVLITVPKQGQN